MALARGQILIATAASHDPDFAQSVILLVHNGPDGAVGLMLNRPTRVTGTYQGGPLEIGVNGLLKTGNAFRVVTDAAEIKRRAATDTPAVFRVYAGQCGWTAEQLQDEMKRGLWRQIPASAATVFDGHPETLWRRLAR